MHQLLTIWLFFFIVLTTSVTTATRIKFRRQDTGQEVESTGLRTSRQSSGGLSDFTRIGANSDCPGNDIRYELVGLIGCAQACAQEPSCVGFVYTAHPSAEAPCWLKNALCDQMQTLSRTMVYEKKRDRAGQCFLGGPISPLSVTPGGWMNVFVTLSFDCQATISGWMFFSTGRGIFNVGIWRPGPDGDTLKLIGKNRLRARTIGRGRASVPEDERIQVQPGDVLGIHYDKGTEEGIIPYEDSRTTPYCCDLTSSHMSPIYNSGAFDEGLDIGNIIQLNMVSHSVRRLPALNAMLIDMVTTVEPEVIVPVVVPQVNRPPPVKDNSEEVCGKPVIPPDADHRIVGGVPAVAHSWPWQVSLQRKDGRHFCGGSLINNQWVLSAAHCQWMWLGRRPEDRRVVMGIHDIQQTIPSEVDVYVTEMIPHADYERTTNLNDIMLLKLSEPIPFVDEIIPICLPEEEETFHDAMSCFATGWGRTQYRGSTSDVLLQVEVPIISQEVCNQIDWYNGKVFDSMLCAGYERGAKDACQGDSGGPLVCEKGGTWKLAGVVSWGERCGEAKKPGVYQRTEYYLDWITENIAKYS